MRNAFFLLLLIASPAFCPGPWKLVWSDEFNTDGPPNPENWNYERGFLRNQEPICNIRLPAWKQKDAIMSYTLDIIAIVEGAAETIIDPV